MANPEHLAILRQGVEVWNQWREEHPDVQPDLRKGDLYGITLPKANMSEGDLREARLEAAILRAADFSFAHLNGVGLHKANLQRANFLGSDLTGANLCRADLREAQFLWANLSVADLTDANLVHADLSQTNLNWADLRGADLSGACFRLTTLGSTNLQGTRGLDLCVYGAPSIIDHQTLVKSGQLPLSFLRGCGLPNALIDYLPSLLNEPIQLYSVFISYSHYDEAFTKRLHDALQNKDVRCWYAPENIQGGKKIYEQIDQALRVYDKLLLVLSEHSMNSEWVKTELANARRREVQENRRMLFPIRLVDFETIKNWTCFDAETGKDSAREIREYFIPDFSNWKDHDSFEQAFDRLLRDLKADDVNTD